LASALFSVNGTSVADGLVTVSPSATVNLAVLDVSGITAVSWEFVGAHAAGVSYPTITATGAPQGVTASFTQPAGDTGQCYRIKCEITDARGKKSRRFGLIGSGNGSGRVPFAAGETDGERHATQGWTDAMNVLVSDQVATLPQIDTTVSSADATPVTVATVALDANHIYEFGVYVQGFGTAATTYAYQKFSAVFARHAGGAAEVTTMLMTNERSSDIASVAGIELVASGNSVIVRWTGHGTLDIKARVQVAHVKRAVELA
jgi:hypothetical protein